MALDIDADSMPPEEVLRAQAIKHGPRAHLQADLELDGIEEDGGTTGTTDDGGEMQCEHSMLVV